MPTAGLHAVFLQHRNGRVRGHQVFLRCPLPRPVLRAPARSPARLHIDGLPSLRRDSTEVDVIGDDRALRAFGKLRNMFCSCGGFSSLRIRIWSTRGIDSRGGGFQERLTLTGEPTERRAPRSRAAPSDFRLFKSATAWVDR